MSFIKFEILKPEQFFFTRRINKKNKGVFDSLSSAFLNLDLKQVYNFFWFNNHAILISGTKVMHYFSVLQILECDVRKKIENQKNIFRLKKVLNFLFSRDFTN